MRLQVQFTAVVQRSCDARVVQPLPSMSTYLKRASLEGLGVEIFRLVSRGTTGRVA